MCWGTSVFPGGRWLPVPVTVSVGCIPKAQPRRVAAAGWGCIDVRISFLGRILSGVCTNPWPSLTSFYTGLGLRIPVPSTKVAAGALVPPPQEVSSTGRGREVPPYSRAARIRTLAPVFSVYGLLTSPLWGLLPLTGMNSPPPPRGLSRKSTMESLNSCPRPVLRFFSCNGSSVWLAG